MAIYCIDDFKEILERLCGKNSYATLEKELIEYFFDKDIEALKSGTNLNNNTDLPYIKKRLQGSGGYRVYYYLIIKDSNVYLLYVHPKRGSLGSPNIKDSYKTELYKKILDSIKSDKLYVVTKNADSTKLVFTLKGNLPQTVKNTQTAQEITPEN